MDSTRLLRRAGGVYLDACLRAADECSRSDQVISSSYLHTYRSIVKHAVDQLGTTTSQARVAYVDNDDDDDRNAKMQQQQQQQHKSGRGNYRLRKSVGDILMELDALEGLRTARGSSSSSSSSALPHGTYVGW